MTAKKRVLAVLKGDMPDRVPFTMYEWKVPWGRDKRRLRRRGLLLVRRFPGWRADYPNCEWTMLRYREGGKVYEREVVKTPKGQVTALFLPDQTCGVRLTVEHWIKGRADYEPLIFMARDAVFRPAYDEIRAADEDLGDDGLVFVFAGYSPLPEIMIRLAGVEQFCYELMERPDCVWALYDALCERERRKFPIVADAPVEMVQYCGNPIASVLGRDLFVRKILPPLEECARCVHDKGKVQSFHSDGDNRPWAEDLARSNLDIIEAFTPAPDTDMTMAEGRAAWPDKILWTNFPSSLHLASPEQVRRTTRELLRAVAPGDRFILGITEDLPANRWRESLSAILDVIEQNGRLPLA